MKLNSRITIYSKPALINTIVETFKSRSNSNQNMTFNVRPRVITETFNFYLNVSIIRLRISLLQRVTIKQCLRSSQVQSPPKFNPSLTFSTSSLLTGEALNDKFVILLPIYTAHLTSPRHQYQYFSKDSEFESNIK